MNFKNKILILNIIVNSIPMKNREIRHSVQFIVVREWNENKTLLKVKL